MLQWFWSLPSGLGWPRLPGAGCYCFSILTNCWKFHSDVNISFVFLHKRIKQIFLFPQRRDLRCLQMKKDVTTPVPVTTVQQRISSMTSTPFRNSSTITNPSMRSSTSKRTISTPPPVTSKPADGNMRPPQLQYLQGLKFSELHTPFVRITFVFLQLRAGPASVPPRKLVCWCCCTLYPRPVCSVRSDSVGVKWSAICQRSVSSQLCVYSAMLNTA